MFNSVRILIKNLGTIVILLEDPAPKPSDLVSPDGYFVEDLEFRNPQTATGQRGAEKTNELCGTGIIKDQWIGIGQSAGRG